MELKEVEMKVEDFVCNYLYVCKLDYLLNIPVEVGRIIRSYVYVQARFPLYGKIMGWCEKRLYYSEILRNSLGNMTRGLNEKKAGMRWEVRLKERLLMEAWNCPKCGEYLYRMSRGPTLGDLNCHCRSWEEDE